MTRTLAIVTTLVLTFACGGSPRGAREADRGPAPASEAARPAQPERAAPPASPLPAVEWPLPSGLGGELVFQSDLEGSPKIYILELRSGTVRQLTHDPSYTDAYPRWSPDGRRIAFTSSRAGEFDLYVMNADGGGVERLTDHPEPDRDPSWAPDGRSLFFTSERDGRGGIYRVWLGDRRVERVTSGPDRAIMPAASPDGRRVAYAAQPRLRFQVLLQDLTTGKGRQITDGSGACLPAWAPDGRALAYVETASEPSVIEVVDLASGERRRLVEDPVLWSYYPAWSPDGMLVAFSVSPAHHEGEDWDLALARLDSPGRFRRLTHGPGNDRLPDWRPHRPEE